MPKNLAALLHYGRWGNFDFWVVRVHLKTVKCAIFAESVLTKCGLPILFACHQVWSGDNNSEPRWQTNIGGIRQIKLAPGWKEDSTAETSSYLEMSSPVRHEAASAPDRQEGLIYCGTRRRGQPQASNAAASQLYPLDP